MDLRVYFSKVREIESALTGDYQVIASLETPDGGKAGIMTEVSTAVASKLLVEGKARLTTEKEQLDYYAAQDEARKAYEQAELAKRFQFQFVKAPDVPTKTQPHSK